MSKLTTKFHYSSYWGSWSRVLSHEGNCYVEVNLTTIPNCSSSSWEDDVAEVVIRRHYTARRHGDIDTDELPRDIHEAMIEHLGKEMTISLLGSDFLPEIDWEKYHKHCNGGCPLDKCLKD